MVAAAAWGVGCPWTALQAGTHGLAAGCLPPGHVWGHAVRRPRHRAALPRGAASSLHGLVPPPEWASLSLASPAQEVGAQLRPALAHQPLLPRQLPSLGTAPMRLRCGETEAEATVGLRQSGGCLGMGTPLQGCSITRSWVSDPNGPAWQGPHCADGPGRRGRPGSPSRCRAQQQPQGPCVSQRPHPGPRCLCLGPVAEQQVPRGGRGGRTWQLPGEAVGRDPRGCCLGPWPWGRVSRWKAGDRAAVPLLEGLVAPASSSPAVTQAGGRKGSRRPHRLCSRPRRPAPEAPVVTPCHAGTVPWAGVAGCVTSARPLAVVEGAGASGSDRPGPNPASAPSQL